MDYLCIIIHIQCIHSRFAVWNIDFNKNASKHEYYSHINPLKLRVIATR